MIEAIHYNGNKAKEALKALESEEGNLIVVSLTLSLKNLQWHDAENAKGRCHGGSQNEHWQNCLTVMTMFR